MAGSIVSFINMKGGVGKTTLCANIGYTLTQHFHKKVLIIDMDPQFNVTQLLMTKFKTYDEYQSLRDDGKTINYVLQKPVGGIAKSSPQYTDTEIICELIKDNQLNLIPGDLELVTFESSRRGSERILNDYLRRINSTGTYDYILIDTPATYSIYSQSSLIASDFYVVPVAPDVFSVLGFNLLKNVMESDIVLQEKSIKQLGIIFTMTRDDRVRRSRIRDNFENEDQFCNTVEEAEYIRTGKMGTFMFDMEQTKNEIINLTQEFINKINEKNR